MNIESYEVSLKNAAQEAEATGESLYFWWEGDNSSIDCRERAVFVTPEGEVWETFPHFWDGNTHYQPYQRLCGYA